MKDSRFRPTRALIAAGLVAFLVVLVTACASMPVAATPCPGFVDWPPSLPAPPASVGITHPVGIIVRVINDTGAPIKVRYRVWTPGDCGASPPFEGEPGSVLAPGKLSEWAGDIPHPSQGPVLGGLEVWTHPCDETCPDPPDAFAAFVIPSTP